MPRRSGPCFTKRSAPGRNFVEPAPDSCLEGLLLSQISAPAASGRSPRPRKYSVRHPCPDQGWPNWEAVSGRGTWPLPWVLKVEPGPFVEVGYCSRTSVLEIDLFLCPRPSFVESLRKVALIEELLRKKHRVEPRIPQGWEVSHGLCWHLV